MSYSKGIMWLDDCRIPFVDEGDRGSIDRSDRNVMMGWKTDAYVNGVGNNTLPPEQAQGSPLGRFTPNLLVCDNMLNDGSIGGSSLFPKTNTPIYNTKNGWNDNNISGSTGGGYSDKGTNSRYYDLDLWFDKMLEKL